MGRRKKGDPVSGWIVLNKPYGLGSTSAVAIDSKAHIWVADRCGANSCLDSPLDPIMEFDEHGKFIKAFGAGLFVFPHGITIDSNDNIWLTDPRTAPATATRKAIGAQAIKFSPSGKILMTLGKPGVTGPGFDEFTEPSAVAVSRQGMIFINDGHDAGRGNSRIMKFNARGKLLKTWGEAGPAQGQITAPHAIAIHRRPLEQPHPDL